MIHPAFNDKGDVKLDYIPIVKLDFSGIDEEIRI